jgi:hypothetical protein
MCRSISIKITIGVDLPNKIKHFLDENHIIGITEILEVFGEPRNDMDGSFRGRNKLVAHFNTATDAVYFYMKIS